MISMNSLHKFVTIAVLLVSSTIPAAEPESLDRTLEPYLKEFGLPALAAAVFKEGVVIAGRQIRRGRETAWDSTLAEVFPELKDMMDAEFAKITLQELLSHSSGLATDGPALVDLLNRSYLRDGNLDEVRYWMVKETAPKPLDHARGSKFAYSNLGYR
jgi:hypothetical protein